MTINKRKSETGEPTNNTGHFGSTPKAESDVELINSSGDERLDAAMTRWDAHEDLIERFATQKGLYSAERVVLFPATETSPETKLRGKLFRTEHAANLTVELWTPNGWAELDDMPVADAMFATNDPGDESDPENLRDHAFRVISDQMIDSLRIVG